MAEQWLSIVEYARHFNISDMTVRRRIKTGRLQAVLREGKYYIPLEGGLPTPSSTPSNAQAPVQSPKSEPIYSRPSEAPSGDHKNFAAKPPQASFVPNHITRNMGAAPQANQSDMSSLLSYCEQSLARLAQVENHLEEKYQAQIGKLKAELNTKDVEIKNLSQQIEDLQVLVKLLEKKAKS